MNTVITDQDPEFQSLVAVFSATAAAGQPGRVANWAGQRWTRIKDNDRWKFVSSGPIGQFEESYGGISTPIARIPEPPVKEAQFQAQLAAEPGDETPPVAKTKPTRRRKPKATK